jgi:hypothetical protein
LWFEGRCELIIFKANLNVTTICIKMDIFYNEHVCPFTEWLYVNFYPPLLICFTNSIFPHQVLYVIWGVFSFGMWSIRQYLFPSIDPFAVTKHRNEIPQGHILEELILHPHCCDKTCTVIHNVWSPLLLPKNWMWKYLCHDMESYETSLSLYLSSCIPTVCFWLASPIYYCFTNQLHNIRDDLHYSRNEMNL